MRDFIRVALAADGEAFFLRHGLIAKISDRATRPASCVVVLGSGFTWWLRGTAEDVLEKIEEAEGMEERNRFGDAAAAASLAREVDRLREEVGELRGRLDDAATPE